ncbi:MAG: site-specific DNA-methyltransferase [Leptospiraceae bacterium]|nr:site-specific DNA-methyltransferase [Leptospiraceae bacterium]
MRKNSALKKEDKVFVGEFWTSKQRQSHKIHYTVSYRAAFKPELPAFFISEYLTKKKSMVMDPFGGRGTTAIQANLDGHFAMHNDINPLSIFLAESRKIIPSMEKLEKRLNSLDLKKKVSESKMDEDLLHFFHKDTLKQIKNLMRIYESDKSPELKYIMLTALSRLHGHSVGFFSVYTFPQMSITPIAQKRNNEKRKQFPDFREIKPRILKKMQTDLKDSLPPFYHEFTKENKYSNNPSENMKSFPTSSVDLIITSPPFLDKVNYESDNWMKSWFLGIKEEKQKGKISMFHSVDAWADFIGKTLKECSRVMKKNAHMVIEVGDVSVGKNIVNLDEIVLKASEKTNLIWERTYINSQKFTKLSNCWNVFNNEKGTNSNRSVVFRNGK